MSVDFPPSVVTTTDEQRTLRILHRVLQLREFYELEESAQLQQLNEVEAILFSQAIDMKDRRRIGNLVAPIAFANVSDEVKTRAKAISDRWDEAPF